MFIDDNNALWNEGISELHARAFGAVARSQDCVVLTRTPGKACGGLLAEGYDAKGFHIKGKSCSWGPMSGFICAEPLFNKSAAKGVDFNAKKHIHSLKDKIKELSGADGPAAGLTPVMITQDRLNWLRDNLDALKGKPDTSPIKVVVKVPEDPKATVEFTLVKRGQLWAVFYDANQVAAVYKAMRDAAVKAAAAGDTSVKPLPPEFDELSARLKEALAAPAIAALQKEAKLAANVVPVLALTNPYPPHTGENAHLNAITGDFDLFAVWPKHPDPQLDTRIIGSDNKLTMAEFDKIETRNAIGANVGNLTQRIYTIGQLLNSEMGKSSIYPLVNRIFHSDEGGRPGVDAIELPVAAFWPEAKSKSFVITDRREFALFAWACALRGYTLYFSEGWTAALKDTPESLFIEPYVKGNAGLSG